MKPLEILLKNLFKYSPMIVLSLLLIFAVKLGLDYKKEAENNKRQYESLIGLRDSYKQLSDYTAILETKYANEKEIRAAAEKQWGKDIKALEGKVKALITVISDISNSPVPRDDTNPSVELFLTKDGKPAMPIGIVTDTYSKVYDFSIKFDGVISKEEDGRVRVLARTSWMQKEPGLDGTIHPPFPLPMTDGTLLIDPTEPVVLDSRNEFRLAPHLNAGLFAGYSEGAIFGGRLGISVWGYGKTKNDLDYKLAEVGINFSRDYIDINLVPIQYRIGNVLPLIEDMYLGAGVGLTPTARSLFVNLSTTF